MNKYLARAASFVIIFFLLAFVFSPTNANAVTNCDTTGIEVTVDEQALFKRVSDWRVQNKNASPLQLSVPLNRAAQWFAKEVDSKTNNGHVDTLGRNWTQRFLDCGYPTSSGTGESIKVNATADAAFDWWVSYTGNGMHAPTAFKCGGIGHYGNSWVVTYGVAVNGICPDAEGGPISTPVPTSQPVCDPYSVGASVGKITIQDVLLLRQEVAELVSSNKGSCFTGSSTDKTSISDLIKARRMVAGLE